ncbi:MAG: hypothetical protein QOF92_4073 [Pseudonocardiales bacterium]|jgi:hypothetical protein|nr:hypothetical protein [Pseudonocardiales bacterium]MDT4931206.1 hypothetical protein [Pseudonocardiales bacterium]
MQPDDAKSLEPRDATMSKPHWHLIGHQWRPL